MRAVLFTGLLLALAHPASAQLIVIDPGHGGTDPGAVGCSLQEASVVLDVSTRAATLLRNAGFRVDLTRTDNRTVSLGARTTFANSRGADRFVSIHANANAGTPATGTETFAHTTASTTSLNLRNRVQEEMIRAWGLRDRGGKQANFHVLRETAMPAALSEMAFINNCSIDATYLGNATRRGQMAEAHYRALMRHYGRDPGSTTPPPPAPSTGTLRGVVFEDTGRGLEDTSARLAGVNVRVDGRAESARTAETGAWSFTLPAGSFTAVATLEGFEEARRACDVAAGGETWCSIGLRRVAAPPPPPPPPPPAEDAGVEPEPEPEPEPVPQPDAAFDTDAGPGSTADAGVRETGGDDDRMTLATGGCAAGGSSSSGAWLFAFGLALLLRRRSRGIARPNGRRLRSASTLGALAALAALAGCSEAAPAPSASALTGAVDLAPSPTSLRVEVARAVEPFARVEDVATHFPEARWVTAELAPVGRRVALAPAGYGALSIGDLASGSTITIAEGPARGFAPRWRADGAAIGARTPGQTESAVPHLAFDLGGQEVAPITAPDAALAWVDEHEQIVVEVPGARHVLRLPGDRYFAPALSSDRRFVTFRGLSTGLYIHDLRAQRTLSLGEGGHARFDPTSRWLVFERQIDDGHDVVESDLYLVDLHAGEVAPLVTSDALDGAPSFGEAGQIAWLADGVLQVGHLVVAR